MQVARKQLVVQDEDADARRVFPASAVAAVHARTCDCRVSQDATARVLHESQTQCAVLQEQLTVLSPLQDRSNAAKRPGPAQSPKRAVTLSPKQAVALDLRAQLEAAESSPRQLAALDLKRQLEAAETGDARATDWHCELRQALIVCALRGAESSGWWLGLWWQWLGLWWLGLWWLGWLGLWWQ